MFRWLLIQTRSFSWHDVCYTIFCIQNCHLSLGRTTIRMWHATQRVATYATNFSTSPTFAWNLTTLTSSNLPSRCAAVGVTASTWRVLLTIYGKLPRKPCRTPSSYFLFLGQPPRLAYTDITFYRWSRLRLFTISQNARYAYKILYALWYARSGIPWMFGGTLPAMHGCHLLPLVQPGKYSIKSWKIIL